MKIRPGWSDALIIVKPETVIGWHRRGFSLFWRWKSRKRKPGRPRISREIRELIRQMSTENGWRVTKIHGELLKLGYDVSPSTVEKYMVRPAKPLFRTWRAFLKNHAADIVACYFFIVPTATFRILFVFFLISQDRRLDHCIILNEDHLIRIFKEYIDSYYNSRRTHIGLDKDCPIPRVVDPPENGNVVSLPILGGLHHHYSRKAA